MQNDNHRRVAIGLALVISIAARGEAQNLSFQLIAPTTGTISYDGTAGGALVGTGIDIDTIVAIGTPLNNLSTRDCVSCTLSFTTGPFASSSSSNWVFSSGGSVVITGGVDLDDDNVIGAGDIPVGTTLAQGSFVGSPSVASFQTGFRIVIAAFVDTKNDALANFYGLPSGSSFEGSINLSFISNTPPPSAFSSVQALSGDVTNHALPLPTSTPTLTVTQTHTPTHTSEPTATSTPTNTNTPPATNTPTSTGAPSSTPTNSPMPSATPSPTLTNSPTQTASSTATPSPSTTQSPSSTPTGTIPATATPSFSQTPTQTGTNTIPPTLTPTHTQTRSHTPTNTPTLDIVEETATPAVGIDLDVEKRLADPAACGPNASNSYVVTVRNVGDTAATGPFTLTDTLPAGLTLLGTSGTGWQCSSPPATVVTCTFSGTLNGGTSTSVTIQVAIGASAGTVLVNEVVVAGVSGELNVSNNTATETSICGTTGAPALGPGGFALAVLAILGVAYLRLRPLATRP